MADGTNTTTDWANVIPTVLSRARDVIEKPTIMTNENVVTVETIKDGDGSTFNWPKFGDLLEADTLSEGEPIGRRQKLIPSTQQFTTTEVGVAVIMTDKSMRVTPERMKARAGRFMGNAVRRRNETDMLGLFSGLSRDMGAGAGNAFDPADISGSVARLWAASESGQSEPIEGEPITVLHPFHYHDLLTSAATLGSNINSTSGYFPIEGLTEQLIREYDVKRLYGTTMVRAPLITIDSNDDAISAIFAKSAFIHVKTSHMFRMERDRDIELRANLMVLTAERGFGELEDQHGIKLTADASVPA